MTAVLRILLASALLSGAASAQQAGNRDDVVQKKDGGFLVGKIVKIDADTIEILVNGEKSSRRVSTKEVLPYSVYKLRSDRIDDASASAHYDLGEFCMANGLYSTAAREFEKAAKDKSLEEKAKKRKEEARNEEARSRFEEAKKLSLEKKYREANDLLHMLIEKFDDTPYFEEAKKEVAKIAEAVKKDVEDKKLQLEQDKKAKEAAAQAVKDNQDKAMLTRCLELLDESQKLWADGLDHEAKNLSRADRSWRSGEAALMNARRALDPLLKSNDVETLKKAKDVEKQVDHWLVKTYYRLGRMWAVELNYPDALGWLNKGMKVPHDEQMDHLLNEVLLTISQLQMRRRAVGAGY